MKSLPSIIFLDWNKTLSNSKFWEQLSDPKHKNHDTFEIIEKALFGKHIDKINPWMLGKLTSEDVCHLLSKETGLEYDFLYKELIHSCKKMEFVSDSIPSLLTEIKKQGVKIMIATDNMDTFSKHTYSSINKNGLFDGFLNSYEIGSFKYDYQNGVLPFFDPFLAKNKLDYQDVVLVDDSIDKKGNLERLGLEVVYVSDDAPLEKILSLYA